MLGIRLPVDAEKELARHAKALGRGKSVIAREWIIDRLERESIDAKMRRSAIVLRDVDKARLSEAERHSTALLNALDAEDGGYDWGPEGPPV